MIKTKANRSLKLGVLINFHPFFFFLCIYTVVRDGKKRQVLLNVMCFIVSMVLMVSYGVRATKASIFVIDFTTGFSYACVQYGLTILNHNTFIRMAVIFGLKMDKKKIDSFFFPFYLLPPFGKLSALRLILY